MTTAGACANSFIRTITWEAEDECGNTSTTFTATLTVNDTIAPTWTTTAGSLDASFICAADVVMPSPPTATDNCAGTVTVNQVSDITTPGVCANSFSRTITWEAEDECGNTSTTFTATLTVNDNIAPTWTTTAGSLNASFICAADVVVPSPPIASDNCASTVTVNQVSDVTTPGACANSFSRTITWEAEDECGNTSTTFTATITVNDNIAPTWATTAGSLNASFICAADVVVPSPPTATDNCAGTVTVNQISDVTTTGACANSFSRTITWEAEDDCGNTSSTFTATLTVNDTIAPT